jgi:hypothetical protein
MSREGSRPAWTGTTATRRDAGPDARALDSDDWPVDGVTGSSRRQSALSRLTAIGLWTTVCIGAVMGVAWLLTPPPTSAAGTSTTPQTITMTAQASPPAGCAELAVAAWLSGDTAALAVLVGGDGHPARLPDGQRRADHTYLVASQQGVAGTWTYTVAADVAALTGATWASAGTGFYAITFAATGHGCGGWSAVRLPAQVPGPDAATAVDVAYPARVDVGGTALGDTLDRFFAALLAGATDLDRYLAPGTTLAAVNPAPYLKTSISAVAADVAPGRDVPADGTRIRLLITINGQTSSGAQWPLVYPLTVAVRGGRWEIAALDPAVAVATPSPSPSTSPSSATPPPAAPNPSSSTTTGR